MYKIDVNLAKEALLHIESGLEKYLNIISQFNQVDVSKDMEFQKSFNGFYRIRQRQQKFYEEFYNFMELNKNKDITFEETLKHLYLKINRVERSFSSKLVATINPNKPVWDQYVMKNLNIKIPSYSSKDRLDKTIKAYNSLEKWYEEYLNSYDSNSVLNLFNEKYPDVEITDVKKIDLILWQMR